MCEYLVKYGINKIDRCSMTPVVGLRLTAVKQIMITTLESGDSVRFYLTNQKDNKI